MSQPIAGLFFSRRWWWTTLLVLVGTAVLVLLGFWQLGRYSQNHAFNLHLAAMQAAPTLDLTSAPVPADLTQLEYQSVQLAGVYDFAHEVAIRNQVWTQTWGDDMGYALLTPLRLADGRGVLVERGWVPLQDNTRNSWQPFEEAGTVTVTGVIRLPAAPEMGGGVPDPTLAPGQSGLDFWNLIDIPRLQKQIPYPLLPVYIQQTSDAARSGYPYPYPSLPDPADDTTNLGYAFVWFLFAGLLFFGYPLYLRNQGEKTAAARR